MRYLFLLNCAVLGLGSVLAVVLGVVCLIYVIYMGREPQLAGEMHLLMVTTGLFAWIASTAGVAVVGQRRNRPWLWAGVAGWVAGFVLIGRIFAP